MKSGLAGRTRKLEKKKKLIQTLKYNTITVLVQVNNVKDVSAKKSKGIYRFKI